MDEGRRNRAALHSDQYDTDTKLSIPEKDAELEDIFNRVVLNLQGFTPLGLENC